MALRADQKKYLQQYIVNTGGNATVAGAGLRRTQPPQPTGDGEAGELAKRVIQLARNFMSNFVADGEPNALLIPTVADEQMDADQFAQGYADLSEALDALEAASTQPPQPTEDVKGLSTPDELSDRTADAFKEIERFLNSADELDLADDTYSVNTLPARKAVGDLRDALKHSDSRLNDAATLANCIRQRAEATEARVAELIEQAAKIVEGDVYAERYRKWPCVSLEGNRSEDSDIAKHCAKLAQAVRALTGAGKKPAPQITDEMAEAAAKVYVTVISGPDRWNVMAPESKRHAIDTCRAILRAGLAA